MTQGMGLNRSMFSLRGENKNDTGLKLRLSKA